MCGTRPEGGKGEIKEMKMNKKGSRVDNTYGMLIIIEREGMVDEKNWKL